MLETITQSPQAPTIAAAVAPALAPVAAMDLALNDPNTWEKYQAFEEPLSPEEIENVQKDIDAIVGQTRDNKSIAKLVWNGDVRYWKVLHDAWDTAGEPISTYKRPQILYKAVFDGEIYLHDAFPPRWLILTRLEPEQYAADWARESMFLHPDLGKMVQILPSECPKERHLYYMTIATHVNECCQRAAEQNRNCFGLYAHPRACLDELRRARRSLEAAGMWESHPFDSPDMWTRRERERGNHNYIENALKQFRLQRERAIEETPFAITSPRQFIASPDLVELRKTLREAAKRDEEKLEKDLQRRQTA